MIKVGDTVKVYSGMSGKLVGEMQILAISRTGKTATVSMPHYATGKAKFYRQDCGAHYIESCGGISFMNSFFSI